jgi:hypothetical protein
MTFAAQRKVTAVLIVVVGAMAVATGVLILWKTPARRDSKPHAAQPSTFQGAPPPRTNREQFSKALARVQEGMTAAAVLDLLGKPDDVRTQYDPGGISTTRTKEIWCYGADGHLTFPTLGSIYIDQNEKAQYIYGGQGSPPSVEIISEKELVRLLRLIDRLPSYNAGHSYDPLPVIRVVNALQPLGKDRALAVISEYLRVAPFFHSPARQGLFLVMRVLFEVPSETGQMPRMYVGGPIPPAPEDLKQLPRFPVLVVDDIPLLLVSGYILAGWPEPAERHVDYFRANGRLRAGPLVPTNTPLSSFDQYAKTYEAAYGEEPDERHQVMIINQLLRLVDSVYRLKADRFGYRFGLEDDVEGRWQRLRAEVTKLGICWNAAQQRYVFKDGSHLPDLEPRIYRRAIWKLDGLAGEAELVFERRDPERVDVSYQWSGRTGTKVPGVVIVVFAVKDPKTPLEILESTNVDRAVSFLSQGCQVDLPEGQEIQAKMTMGKKARLSPVYRP